MMAEEKRLEALLNAYKKETDIGPDKDLSLIHILKSIYLCLAESVFFRFIQAFTRMTAFIGYRKKKNVWGQIQRQKIQLNQSSEQNVEKKIEGKK